MLTGLDRTLDTQGPVSTDRTRPVALSQVWTLTGVDRTLALSVRSHDLPASGQPDLITSVKRTDRTLRPASGRTGASVRSVFDPPFTSNFRTNVNEVCSKGS